MAEQKLLVSISSSLSSRLSDNPALLKCVEGAATWRAVFILDPTYVGSRMEVNKWRWVHGTFKSFIRTVKHRPKRTRFLLQSLTDLDASLRRLGSRLFVARGQPMDVLPRLLRDWSVDRLTFERDPEAYGRDRDRKVMALCKRMGVDVAAETSHTLYTIKE